jgi:hypothetical protein
LDVISPHVVVEGGGVKSCLGSQGWDGVEFGQYGCLSSFLMASRGVFCDALGGGFECDLFDGFGLGCLAELALLLVVWCLR